MLKGSCLCGAVKVSLINQTDKFTVCHCGMCRKWGGGPAFSVDCTNSLKLSGEENITIYGSSEFAERGFCKKCGTHLFYRLKNSEYSNISLGLLDQADDLVFESQVFIDMKPHNYDFSNVTTKLTEEEILELFSQGES